MTTRTREVVILALRDGADLRFADLEIDSLSRFEFIMHVEEALDLDLDDDDIVALDTLNGLIAYLETAVQARAG